MNIEEEIFKKSTVNINKLLKYGFIKKENKYEYSRFFHNDKFKVIVSVGDKVTGKIIDTQTNDEYTNFRVKNEHGAFANSIREYYKEVLEDIRDNCFDTKPFIFDQSNRIANYIYKKYNDKPEYLWKSAPGYAVFKEKAKNKWYGIIMNIDRNKIDKSSGEVEIINVKVEPDVLINLKNKKGFYEAYHMNKKNWITIILDNTIDDNTIFEMIDNSYKLINN